MKNLGNYPQPCYLQKKTAEHKLKRFWSHIKRDINFFEHVLKGLNGLCSEFNKSHS
jgi:hypothetical protein